MIKLALKLAVARLSFVAALLIVFAAGIALAQPAPAPNGAQLMDDGARLALLALESAHSGQWGLVVGFALAALVWLLRTYGRKLLPKLAVFFDQPLVAAALPTVVAMFIDGLLAVKAGAPPSLGLFLGIITNGLTGNGAFNVMKKIAEQVAVARAKDAGATAAAAVTDGKSAVDLINRGG